MAKSRKPNSGKTNKQDKHDLTPEPKYANLWDVNPILDTIEGGEEY